MNLNKSTFMAARQLCWSTDYYVLLWSFIFFFHFFRRLISDVVRTIVIQLATCLMVTQIYNLVGNLGALPAKNLGPKNTLKFLRFRDFCANISGMQQNIVKPLLHMHRAQLIW